MFPNFGNFMFMSNEHFERIPGYYQLVNKPITESEIQSDYLLREWNGSKCLAIVRAYCQNFDVQQSILLQMIQRGGLIQTPY